MIFFERARTTPSCDTGFLADSESTCSSANVGGAHENQTGSGEPEKLEEARENVHIPECFIEPLRLVIGVFRDSGASYRLGGSAANAFHDIRREILERPKSDPWEVKGINDIDVYTDDEGFELLRAQLSDVLPDGYSLAVQELVSEEEADKREENGEEREVDFRVGPFGHSKRLAIFHEGKELVEVFGESRGGSMQLWNPNIAREEPVVTYIEGVGAVELAGKNEMFANYLVVATREILEDVVRYLSNKEEIARPSVTDLASEPRRLKTPSQIVRARTKVAQRFDSLRRLLKGSEKTMIDQALGMLAAYEGLPHLLGISIRNLSLIRKVFVPEEGMEQGVQSSEVLDFAQTKATIDTAVCQVFREDIGGLRETLAPLASIDLKALRKERALSIRLMDFFRKGIFYFAEQADCVRYIQDVARQIAERNPFPENIFFRFLSHATLEQVIALVEENRYDEPRTPVAYSAAA
ncbi:MAG TPA: hypothetical protein DCY48_03560 [Candidatus Magasanikbacteria bacterium]|nr:MAG: hypothetical protein A3I74_04715 [Candidatus Magasanikbacteria bacterium RIFCSPLOWO2_02_FULL_47_16]OGH79508.1 MAG: hypothetical protein A3C10_01685 [Candidatus Magasanikbacteria bacterium RIFCSPHIGHO2_02_FULL_48_18]HAZ28821.1 hypothetical protein [Candidatus Magasanikbacteria bacterium]